MKVTLEEITEDTLGEILELEVRPDQTELVASVAVSIARAHFSRYSWFRAIYVDDTPVGFAMLYLDGSKPEYVLRGLLIDRRHQRKGYGTAAMRQLIEFVRSLPEARELELRYLPKRGVPIDFFARFGFAESGEEIDGERVMRLVLDEL